MRQNRHQMIFETLRKEILLGKFNMREKFLSEQQLCRRFSVARATVRLALARLKDAGMLETRSGSGTYLSATARNATGRLGMIVPGIASGEIFPPLCAEIARVARENGYEVLFGDASSHDSERRAQQAIELAHRYIGEHVAGVFLEPIELVPDAPYVTNRIIKLLSENSIPVVLLDRDVVSPPERSPYDLVGLDNVQIGCRLARHLIAQGARRICCYTRPGSAPTVRLRFAGARDAILDARLPWSAACVCEAEPDDFGAVARMMAARTPPDAFLCGNDMSAVAVLRHLLRLRLKVPRDVMVTGVDDVACARGPAAADHDPPTLRRTGADGVLRPCPAPPHARIAAAPDPSGRAARQEKLHVTRLSEAKLQEDRYLPPQKNMVEYCPSKGTKENDT